MIAPQITKGSRVKDTTPPKHTPTSSVVDLSSAVERIARQGDVFA
jgi:hypothetical protein